MLAVSIIILVILKGFVMVKLKKGRRTTGPSSTIGLMRFFDTESKGPKVSPEFVIIASAAVGITWIVLQHFFH